MGYTLVVHPDVEKNSVSVEKNSVYELLKPENLTSELVTSNYCGLQISDLAVYCAEDTQAVIFLIGRVLYAGGSIKLGRSVFDRVNKSLIEDGGEDLEYLLSVAYELYIEGDEVKHKTIPNPNPVLLTIEEDF